MQIEIFVFIIELYFRYHKKRVFEFDSLKQKINCPRLLPRSLPKYVVENEGFMQYAWQENNDHKRDREKFSNSDL